METSKSELAYKCTISQALCSDRAQILFLVPNPHPWNPAHSTLSGELFTQTRKSAAFLLARLLNTQVENLGQITVSDAVDLMAVQKIVTNSTKHSAGTIHQVNYFLKSAVKSLELNELNVKLTQLQNAEKQERLIVLDLVGGIRSGSVWQEMTVNQASLFFNLQLNNALIVIGATLTILLSSVPVCCSRWWLTRSQTCCCVRSGGGNE